MLHIRKFKNIRVYLGKIGTSYYTWKQTRKISFELE